MREPKQDTFKVRITKCSFSAYWYKKRVGQIFEVTDNDKGNKYRYDDGDFILYIAHEDAERVDDDTDTVQADGKATDREDTQANDNEAEGVCGSDTERIPQLQRSSEDERSDFRPGFVGDADEALDQCARHHTGGLGN